MSALTYSPSPAASPKSNHYVRQRLSHTAPSPRAAVYPSAWTTETIRLRRPSWNSSPPAQAASAPTSRLPPPIRTFEAVSKKAVTYVDSGTQYSPDGYPPTAGLGWAGETTQHQTLSRSGQKRAKETSANPSGQPSCPNSHEFRSPRTHPSPPKRFKSDASNRPKIMPDLYGICEPRSLGALISKMLLELIQINDQRPLLDARLTRFHSRTPPGISVSDYLQRLVHHATISPPILMTVVWYIDGLSERYPKFAVNSLTVHRYLITAVTVASKALSDVYWKNSVYARIGGISLSELATLELEFLQKMQWNVIPQPETLEEYYQGMVERTEGFELESAAGKSGSTSVNSSGPENDLDEAMT